MNLENKKQVATISLAVGLGLVAVFLMGQYIESDINKQTKAIATTFKKEKQGLVSELDNVKSQLTLLSQQQEALAREQRKLASMPFQLQQDQRRPIISMEAFSVMTPPGKRAITVALDPLNAVGGLITPGDFVDVIGHYDIPHPGDDDEEDKRKRKKKESGDEEDSEDKSHLSTTILFQNVQVLAVGKRYRPTTEIELTPEAQPTSRRDKKTKEKVNVTLALSTQEAALVAFTENNGYVQLALRAPADPKRSLVQVASWDTLAAYVYENNGSELVIPQAAPAIEAFPSIQEDVRPFIQIFKGGEEANF